MESGATARTAETWWKLVHWIGTAAEMALLLLVLCWAGMMVFLFFTGPIAAPD